MDKYDVAIAMTAQLWSQPVVCLSVSDHLDEASVLSVISGVCFYPVQLYIGKSNRENRLPTFIFIFLKIFLDCANDSFNYLGKVSSRVVVFFFSVFTRQTGKVDANKNMFYSCLL